MRLKIESDGDDGDDADSRDLFSRLSASHRFSRQTPVVRLAIPLSEAHGSMFASKSALICDCHSLLCSRIIDSSWRQGKYSDTLHYPNLIRWRCTLRGIRSMMIGLKSGLCAFQRDLSLQ